MARKTKREGGGGGKREGEGGRKKTGHSNKKEQSPHR